ncbi:MAG: amphi-Trp domain-containing protein [Thermoanaerobacterales bacterium]|nr:amphi-Trp domain-containing protein [Bacillota bacterium]MDI6906654.1 amphi-Trp domain-containing protein [Thermoanaerobacterales bacterium]
MKIQEKCLCTPEQLTRRLQEYLDQIARGRLTVQGKTVRLPDTATLEIELEEEGDGALELELEVKWSFKGGR